MKFEIEFVFRIKLKLKFEIEFIFILNEIEIEFVFILNEIEIEFVFILNEIEMVEVKLSANCMTGTLKGPLSGSSVTSSNARELTTLLVHWLITCLSVLKPL